ncbi:ATP-binding protein [Candidatus Woesearchaeota archaeon]|nr:ATP-binding protein [Candidatus Woesearchaeota archaeon]
MEETSAGKKTKGLIIRGEFGKIIARQKAGKEIEIGELLVAESADQKMLLEVVDLLYASQLSEQNIELISGMELEKIEQEDREDQEKHQNNDERIFLHEQELRNYTLAQLKGIISIKGTKTKACKALPNFLSSIREVEAEDLDFLAKEQNALFLGMLRSGSKILPVPISLPTKDTLSHHILISATTGKGKSNLTSVLLWDATKKQECGILVLDPHDEYYGRETQSIGMKDHPMKNKIEYYTPKNPPIGTKTLKVNLMLIKPQHFAGVVQWSDPQEQALHAYYREFGSSWIEKIMMNVPLQKMGTFNEATIAVARRRLLSILDLEWSGHQLLCHGIFDLNAGSATVHDICNELEEAKTVIIDTSNFKGATELLIGSMISTEILQRYQNEKRQNTLRSKPIISIIIEEAPRVLGKEVLERGGNIFSTIAREGRKFQVGLCAITQLPSLIPREILANMNTKIILGTEMAAERQAIIESAAQDLSQAQRAIASLDKGEAIVTSNFARFALPIKAPLFEEYAAADIAKYKQEFGDDKEEKVGFMGFEAA